MLTKGSNELEIEILWNFSRYQPDSGKRITLVENPYFYHHHWLHIRPPNTYKDGFNISPMEDYQYANKICVLTGKPGRVYLEFGTESKQESKSRVFDNVWRTTNGIFIFKSNWFFSPFSSHLPTSFQASPENSKVNVLSEHPFKTGPASGVTWSLSLLSSNRLACP